MKWWIWIKENMFLAVIYSWCVVGPLGFIGHSCWKKHVKNAIEDECWAYLHGKVYCPGCKTKHPIASIYAEQVWKGGSSDEGWVAYVFAERFKDGSFHDSFGYDLTLHNRRVVSMKYDPDCHPITGE